MVSARQEKETPQTVRVLVAVEPVWLFQVMKHLLAVAPEIRIISSPSKTASLEEEAKRLQPDLVITNARRLGEQARTALANTKRVSPHSKIILTDFDARLGSTIPQDDADIYLEEERLVETLLPAARSLTGSGKPTTKLRTMRNPTPSIDRSSNSRRSSRKRAG